MYADTRVYTAASDVYSMAIVLSQLLRGTSEAQPSDSTQPAERYAPEQPHLSVKRKSHRLAPLHRDIWPNGLIGQILEVIQQATQRSTVARPTAGELSIRLEQLTETSGNVAQPPPRECVICFERPIAVRFRPCCHSCVCRDCAPRLRECPVCNGVIKDAEQGVFEHTYAPIKEAIVRVGRPAAPLPINTQVHHRAAWVYDRASVW